MADNKLPKPTEAVAEQDTSKLAKAIIGDAFAGMVEDFQAQVTTCETALASARLNLDIARRQQAAWRRDGTFDQVVGFRATAMAQSADLAPTDLPPGIHLRALASYLSEHHPT